MPGDFEDHCWKDIVDREIIKVCEPYRREVGVGRRPAVLRSTSTTRSIRAAIVHPLNRICSNRHQAGKQHSAVNAERCLGILSKSHSGAPSLVAR